jgi:hypothetical protein
VRFVATALVLAAAPASLAQVDTLQTVVSQPLAVGNVPAPPALGTFGYDPVNHHIYVAGFAGADQQLRRIDNVDGGGAMTAQTQVFATAWQLFTKNGDLNNGGGIPVPSALLLNPQPIPALGLGSFANAWITDINGTITQASVNHPEWTQRIYKYNLQQDANANASDEFTSQMTLETYRVAAGAGAASLTSNVGRQFAWSGDGQSIYFIDSSANVYGGIWKLPVAGGPPTRLLVTTADTNTEPAVLASGGVDTIFFRGAAATANLGGIDKITHGGTNTSARTVAYSAATINDFLELNSGNITTFSMTADADGNLYFNDTSSNRPGIYRIDPQGRFSKVVSRAERQATFAVGTQTVNANTLRMQPRTTTFGIGSSAFSVTQILYAEPSPINLIAGAYVFKPGDFNRDNVVDQADVSTLKPIVTLRGVPQVDTANLKFDMNGNGAVDWKDIKIFQTFYPQLFDGDATMNGTVDVDDLGILASNWQTGGRTWRDADFTGDDLVDVGDLGMLASNWQAGVPLAPALAAFGLPSVSVPEPGCAALGGLVVWSVSKRHRRHP